ncbi:hypothetical protein GCM10011511_49450 [Puia dinghuensis]|uniref:Cytochrome c domain-containing protein n=2 Tax=Puia dinghuensis TaxID=1792502 RepID=A0A8J2UHQ2_9BACT|nr:hypothetical protein GCM10011511_49450 [Puia dinghuensis]
MMLWSCNDSGGVHDPNVGDLLPSISFVVDPGKDTVLKTPGGALLRIAAGTFETSTPSAVQLEVKEAFNPTDMLRGRLIRSNSDDLSSGGIIYINVAAGQSVSINKPISVSIPAKDPQPGMMVYKGEAADSDRVNWTDPRSLEGSSAAAAADDAGKTLFESRCASCHGLRNEVAAPPMAWITRRRDRQWLYSFTRNNATLLWRGDAYSCYLFNRYKAPMPLFKDLSDTDLASLYHYVDRASRGIDSNSVVDHRRAFDSCVHNDPTCAGTADRAQASAPSASQDPGEGASASQGDAAAYYTFSIDKHGWYNVARKGGESARAGASTRPDADAATNTTAKSDAAASSSTSASASSGNDATTADPVKQADASLQACPCWCNEAAYRRADSLGRDRSGGRR